ncbi:hypothetical protein NRB56_65610 [Nocardia sp. RB56]|uniref:Uncharacterized protein n=1 Tax=Nocardia aurantia TaxID=2585199 RepID=A0A7K0DYS0_9NOCA|nr:hypothetical protein [Nocardia aurantia]
MVKSGTPVREALRRRRTELPPWAFGSSGTRFEVFAQPGVPRDSFGKVADAARVHRVYRGGFGGVAAHPPFRGSEYLHIMIDERIGGTAAGRGA